MGCRCVFPGIREESGEVIVGTKEGVLKARSFKRKGSAEERWNAEEILGVVGVPWEPIPGKGSIQLRTHIRFPEDTLPQGEIPVARREYKSRRFKIRKEDLEDCGTQVGCPGCDAFIMGAKAVMHSESCRQRITEALTIAGDPRMMEMLNQPQDD